MSYQNSNQVKSIDANTITTVNNNTHRKKKKLTLTNELLGGIMQFKRMITSQKNDHKISFLDPVKRENVKLSYYDKKDTKRVLNVGFKTLQDVIFRERSHRQDYVVNLTKHLNELRQLNCAKKDHIKNLENSIVEEDRIIASLGVDNENIHNAYETQRRCFYQYYLKEFEHSVLLKPMEKLKLICDDTSKINIQSIGDITIESKIKDLIESLCFDVHSLVSHIKNIEFSYNNEQSKTEIIKMAIQQLKDVDIEKLIHISLDNLVTIFNLLDNDCPQINNFLAFWYVIRSVYENNQILENTADILDCQMKNLKTKLSDVTSKYMTLSANKCDKKCESVVLDDFCAVTEEITVQQIRSLEFSRIIAVDDKQISEDLNKIKQLKSKIEKKKKKKEMLLRETDSVKRQLEAYENQYEELELKKSLLTEDLIGVKRSPGKLWDQSETHGFGQRAKNLKHLRMQHSKLTNKRDALKVKLQKYQQVAKTPNRMNQFLKP